MIKDQEATIETLAEWLDHIRDFHEASPAKSDPYLRRHIERLRAWRELILSSAYGKSDE